MGKNDDKPFGKEWIADKLNARDDGAKDDHEVILPLTRHADGRLSVAGNVDRDIHAIMSSMESELLNLPDYATARFKALLAELKAKL